MPRRPDPSVGDELAVAKIIPFDRPRCLNRYQFDRSARSTYELAFNRTVHISRGIHSAEARNQKINALDRGFLDLLAEVRMSVANGQTD